MGHFTILDGSIVGLYLVGVMIVGIMVRKYLGKVEDFMLAGREVNVYLGIASLAATEFGIVTCMYTAQQGYVAGFAGATPGVLYAASMILVGYTGFCIKPLRSAGVVTIPALFEKKYGQLVRWLSGVVIVLGGLLNMGVFLRTGGDFLVNITGLNPKYLVITMTVLLCLVAVYTILGGMLSALVTNYFQFIVMSAGLIIVTIVIMGKVGWGTLTATVQSHYGASGFNPFIYRELLDKTRMGWDYVLFNAFVAFSCVLTWQTMIQHALSAKDAKTGQKIYRGTGFFFVCRFVLPGLWGIAALATLGPTFDVGPNALLAMPRFLSTFLPMGLMGVLVAAMLAADMSTDSVYMVSWSNVIYNDIIAPFRKTKWSDKRGIMVNRFIVALIGIFLFLYGLKYPLKSNLWTYLILTGSIYLSSMSVLLIACCYWKKANSWGAIAAIVAGAATASSYLILEQWPATEHFVRVTVGENLWGVLTYVITAVAMVVFSLLKPLCCGTEKVES
jgi:SSS family solute:Na+ symporter